MITFTTLHGFCQTFSDLGNEGEKSTVKLWKLKYVAVGRVIGLMDICLLLFVLVIVLCLRRPVLLTQSDPIVLFIVHSYIAVFTIASESWGEGGGEGRHADA